jgi:hypothetical protein
MDYKVQPVIKEYIDALFNKLQGNSYNHEIQSISKEYIDTIFSSIKDKDYWGNRITLEYFSSKVLQVKDFILKDFLFNYFTTKILELEDPVLKDPLLNYFKNKYHAVHNYSTVSSCLKENEKIDTLLDYLEGVSPNKRDELIQYVFSKMCLVKNSGFTEQLFEAFINHLHKNICLSVIIDFLIAKNITIGELIDDYVSAKCELGKGEE